MPTGPEAAPALSAPAPTERDTPIDVLVVDDHPAVRAGLESVIEREDDLVCVASVGSAAQAVEEVEALAPDVVVLDYQLGATNGLTFARKLKELPGGHAVLIYSAYADSRLAVLAVVAGADGVLSKSTRGDEVCDAIRSIAAGCSLLPRMAPETLRAIGRELDPDDLAILGMLVHGTEPAEIARVLGISERWLEARRWSMVTRLEVKGLAPGRRSGVTAR